MNGGYEIEGGGLIGSIYRFSWLNISNCTFSGNLSVNKTK